MKYLVAEGTRYTDLYSVVPEENTVTINNPVCNFPCPDITHMSHTEGRYWPVV